MKGCSSKFHVGSQVWQTPEEDRRSYRPKSWGNNNKNEDNSPKTLNDKNHQASSQKFRQLKILDKIYKKKKKKKKKMLRKADAVQGNKEMKQRYFSIKI